MKGIGFVLFLIVGFWFAGCVETPEKQYKKWEEQEFGSGIRYDSLFKGLYFGMKHETFRNYCYFKNTVEHDFKMQGANTSWLESKIDEMDYPAAINFYPVFDKGVITEMNALIYYKDAVFNDGVFERDSLLLDVLNLMKKWYGHDFIKIKSPHAYQDDVYVSVRGNRRISVFPPLTTEVRVWMVDLYARKEEE